MTGVPLQIDQESYRILVESVSDYAIFLLDMDGCIVSWNKGAAQIKGYPADEVIGRHISIFYTPEDLAAGAPGRNLQIARQFGRFDSEGWRLRKNGSRFWAAVTITLLRDEAGKPVGFGKVTRDLTGRRSAEEEEQRLKAVLRSELQKSQTETMDYRHALDESSIVAITDQKGIIKYVNENFCRISKYSREELIGQDHRIINSGFHSPDFIRDLWVTIANGRIWRGELRNRAKDGTHYWVDTTIVPFLNDEGKPYQYVAIRSDITGRKMAEEEVLKINGALERTVVERTLELTEALNRERELNELKSRFVSMASHEFRTPLSTILSSVSLIGRYHAPQDEEKRLKHIDRIKSSVKHLTEILDDFLSLDKLEQGKVEVHSIAFNLLTFLEETIDEMAEYMRKKQQAIHFSHSGVPSVLLDKKVLHNILLNLISNASKYSPEDSTIDVTAHASPRKLVVEVRDRGIGIPREVQDKIFSKYFRASNAVNIQGTGLGLNIVKRYVELLDGSISFTSAENEGTVFRIELPLQDCKPA